MTLLQALIAKNSGLIKWMFFIRFFHPLFLIWPPGQSELPSPWAALAYYRQNRI